MHRFLNYILHWALARLDEEKTPRNLWLLELEEPLFQRDGRPSRKVLDEEMRMFRAAQQQLQGG